MTLTLYVFYLNTYYMNKKSFTKFGGSTHLAIRQSNKFADRIYGIGKKQAIKNFKIMKRKHNF